MTTTRRQFLRGAVSAAVAASLPGGDGVALYSATHPQLSANEWQPLGYKDLSPAPVFLPFTSDRDTGMFRSGNDTLSFVTQGTRIHQMLEELEIDIPE